MSELINIQLIRYYRVTVLSEEKVYFDVVADQGIVRYAVPLGFMEE